MIRSLYTAACGMSSQQMNIDNIANNMANVNTNGFKKASIQFQDLIYQTIKEAGSRSGNETQTPVELTVGVGVKPASTQKSFIQGSLNNTGNPLDVAINGDGFFQITKPDGSIAYTRDGSFKLSSEGRLVNANGFYLEPNITIPADTEAVNITPEGTVLAKIFGEAEPQESGQIELARFVNPAGLKSIGGNLFEQTPASGEPFVGTPGDASFGTLNQSYLENSNVIIVDEMVRMITAQRAYELNSKMVRAADEMISGAIQIKR